MCALRRALGAGRNRAVAVRSEAQINEVTPPDRHHAALKRGVHCAQSRLQRFVIFLLLIILVLAPGRWKARRRGGIIIILVGSHINELRHQLPLDRLVLRRIQKLALKELKRFLQAIFDEWHSAKFFLKLNR